MRRILASLVVMLSLAGCALPGVITPETPREKLVAAEAAYEVVLFQIKSLVVNGLITPGDRMAMRLITILDETRAALDAWQDNPDDLSLSVAAKHALVALRGYLLLFIPTQESNYEPCGHPWNSACVYLA